jgi:glutathione S-transferase
VLRLVTIPISHYCEKARWALDRARIAYREERHVQGIHRLAARRAGGGITVPVLVTSEEVLGESEAILEWVDQRSPSELRLLGSHPHERSEIRQLCRRFDAELGPRGRRLMYVHMFGQRDLALEFNNQGVPGWEGRVLRWGWRPAARFVARELNIYPGVEAEDEPVIWREFDFVADRLADSESYLCGDRFSAADLTFAALAAPMILPANYGVPLPRPDVLAPAFAALISRAREHPAGQFALSMFAEHRDPLVRS